MANIFIKTFGCSMNFSDSEVLEAILIDAGHKITSKQDADIIIINSCAVKGKTENVFFKYLNEVTKNKKVIVAGCIAQSMPESLEGVSLVGVSDLSQILTAVEQTLSGNIVDLTDRSQQNRLDLPSIRKNPVVEIVPISQGCLGNCTFCITKFARGNLQSFPKEKILKKIEDAVTQGVKEIWLTSQDTGCYGVDTKSNIAELLQDIVKIPGDFKLRLGMANPQWVIKNLDKLLKVFQSDKLFKFLHVPLQSGSDKVLKRMKRGHSVQDFIDIVGKFRKRFPRITISTDIIVGFPGETEKDFASTIELLNKTKPDVLNLSRFTPRPRTEALEMPGQIHGNVSKVRSQIITKIFNMVALQNNLKWLNWKGDVIIDEHGKDNTFIGRNFAYKPVIVRQKCKLGDTLKIKVKEYTEHDLRT